MARWSDAFRRPQRRRRTETGEDGHPASSPEVLPTYDEAGRHPADRLLPPEVWSPGYVTRKRDPLT